MLTLVAAVREESQAVLKAGDFHKLREDGETALWEGGLEGHELMLLQSGMGRENTERAMRWFLEGYSPSAVVSVGFAAGLSPSLNGGQCIAYSEVCAQGLAFAIRCGVTPGPVVFPSPQMLSRALLIAQQKELALSVVSGVTVPRLLLTSRDKKQVAVETGAEAADLEGFYVGLACLEHDLPFVVVRTVLDEYDEELPSFIEDGGASAKEASIKVASYAIRNPWKLSSLIGLARHYQKAKVGLARLASALVAGLSIEGIAVSKR